ncbi:signal recognition particle-docking protein FtsY [Aquamicrobium soli]|uniref:Signal recognition particle receptor FtsY n=1 Tax=Aquamicrobium soli TaxID=1811518 RepID=A0ABV7KI98_9HYPH
MAFGFIKKVFSFGRKEVVEDKPADEAAPLPPLNLDALEGLKPVEETPSSPAGEGASAPSSPVAPSSDPSGHLLPGGENGESPASEPAASSLETSVPSEPVAPEPVEQPTTEPEPAPVEVPQEPEPVEPTSDEKPASEPEPTAEPVPEEEPAPVEVPEKPAPAPAEQQPVPPPEVPATPPPEAPPARPREVPAPETPAEVPSPPAEVPPPAETPAKPASPKAGKVTVAKKVEQKAEPVAAPAPQPRKSWFQRMRDGLARSSKELSGNIAGVFTRRKLDEDTLQDLEDVLIRADLGVETALRVTDALAASRYGKEVSDADVRAVMAAEVEKVLGPVAMPLELDLSHKPHVVLVVGVNGTGKTTTIGKLAAKLTEGGLSVMLAAGDTFRAAAIEQLKIWGERTGSPVVATKLGADAAGLAYDAFEKAKEAGSDVLIIDTAGRLQNKTELMAELEKIVRVLGKLDPEAPHTVLQTVDATTGQNALSQVEIFRNVAGVNGLVMTKLDGTARGGILVAIASKHKLPVYFIGVGEQVDDLEPFSASEFAKAIAGVA